VNLDLSWWTFPPISLKGALVVVLAALAIGGCDDGEPTAFDDQAADVIGLAIVDYCTYGAVSQAQLEGCLAHTTMDEIANRETNAARRARGCPPGLSDDECLARVACRSDAGPFCEDGPRQDRALRAFMGLD
jgi:hypothetical protein